MKHWKLACTSAILPPPMLLAKGMILEVAALLIANIEN
jgi:hypothetical protein